MIASAHDVSSGGLILALTEMCLFSGYALNIEKPIKLSNLIKYYFGEDQGRYLLEIEPNNLQKVTKYLSESNIFFEKVAVVQKNYFEMTGEFKININDLCEMNSKWYNSY